MTSRESLRRTSIITPDDVVLNYGDDQGEHIHFDQYHKFAFEFDDEFDNKSVFCKFSCIDNIYRDIDDEITIYNRDYFISDRIDYSRCHYKITYYKKEGRYYGGYYIPPQHLIYQTAYYTLKGYENFLYGNKAVSFVEDCEVHVGVCLENPERYRTCLA